MNLHGQTLSFVGQIKNRPSNLDDPLLYQAYCDFLLYSVENEGIVDAFIKSEKNNGSLRTPETPIRFFEFVTEHYWHKGIEECVNIFADTLPHLAEKRQ